MKIQKRSKANLRNDLLIEDFFNRALNGERLTFDLDKFSLEDLITLKEEIEYALEHKQKKFGFASVKEEVTKKGYACRPREYYDQLDPKISHIDLPYYFNVYTYSRGYDDYDKDIRIWDRDVDQEPWIKYLNFGDDFEVIIDWHWDDWESPATAKACLKIP